MTAAATAVTADGWSSPERWLRPAEVQAVLGLGRTATYDLIAAGTWTVLAIGGRTVRVSERSLLAWIRARTVRGDTDGTAWR